MFVRIAEINYLAHYLQYFILKDNSRIFFTLLLGIHQAV